MRVLALAQALRAEVYLVGGYVRDALLDKYSPDNLPHDFDYAVTGYSAIKLAERYASQFNGHFVLLDEENQTARVVMDDGVTVDFAGCVGDNINTDIKRRDFSINALVWDPKQPDLVIDLVDGVQDLDRGVVRAVSDAVLHEDPLRMLRAFRFAATLGFTIDGHTLAVISSLARLLNQSAGERISHELFIIMESNRAAHSARLMGDNGLLEVIFPEMVAMHRVTPNSYHHLALYDHSHEALLQAELAASHFPKWARDSFCQEIAHHTSRLAATKLATLLHDIGKPDTWVIADDGRHTFIGHDKLGAQMCEPIAKRLKWSQKIERLITDLVRWHLRPGQLYHQGLPTDRAIYRFYRNIGDAVPELILLALSDFRATCGPGLQEGRELLEKQLRELLDGYIVFKEGTTRIPRLMDGADVMKLLGLNPGPHVGEILEALQEAQGLREVLDREQAEAFVQSWYREKYSK